MAVGGFFASMSLTSLITDWWWFSAAGYTGIFAKSLAAKGATGLIAGLIAAAALLVNVYIAARSRAPWTATIPAALSGQELYLDGRVVRKVSVVISLVAAFFIGLIASAHWQDVLRYLSATPFGATDPLFGKDVAFYVFSLPVYSLGLSLIKALIILPLVGCGIIYVLRGSIDLSGIIARLNLSRLAEDLPQPELEIVGRGRTIPTGSRQARRRAGLHIGILVALFLASIAASTRLSLYNLLITQSGAVFGAAFTDANVMVPLLRLETWAFGVAALLALYFGISGKIRPLLGSVALSLLIGLVSAVVPAIYQKLVVAPNELTKETPFIRHSIEATRRAYGLDKIEERNIAADKPIGAADIAANQLTIKNVRLWDQEPLLSTFSQIQEIRTYYEFSAVDNDRYVINNELRQIMLSPRELASESLPNKNWINERLTFTHGYGVAAGPVNQVTPEGLPVLFVKDLPPRWEVQELAVLRPEIYFGERLNDYVVARTRNKEFDYPKGDDNVYTTYEGGGGVQISSLVRRLFFALRFSSLKLLLSSDVTGESRILYYRNIRERAAKITPFLSYDRDPYLVIADGKLYWIMDAYTSSGSYPYSQPLPQAGERINYIRNSVKAIIDAYDGSVSFYQVDPDDPIINTYARIFPNTFRPLSDMPASLLSHLRYPEGIFALQAAVYTIFHMDDPQIFYNKEDQWEIPAVAPDERKEPGRRAASMPARHMIMRLPGEEKEEYILMLPFTPRAKDNLSAWMVARSDGELYGQLIVYRFPKDKLIFGPNQVIGRINQDAEISRQISLWDQRGSQVFQGSLVVIPVEESLVYVRPLYLQAEAGKIPELKRVIVAYENKIAMEETLEAGLAVIFGTALGPKAPTAGEPAATTRTDGSKEQLIEQLNEAYQAAMRAQRAGEWAGYGEEVKKLGELINRLRQ
jgi:uncharacterized membrane protein (UPF0182 family)